MGTRVRAIFVGRDEVACWVVQEILKCLRQLGIVDFGVESADDCSYIRIAFEVSKVEGLECVVLWILHHVPSVRYQAQQTQRRL